MRLRFVLGLALLAVVLISGCQGPPPTMYVLVVTATPPGTEDAATAEATAQAQPVTAAVTVSPMPTAQLTVTPDTRPTATVGQIQVAEQVFEHGRMLWIQPRGQIWVMIEICQGSGRWLIFDDTFQDGEPESDPALLPPSGMYQPERGFGKLWREAGDLRQELGWGITPEFGYISQYEYHAGGSVDASGQYVRGPGYHIVFSLASELFRLNEDGTWQLGNG